MPKSLDRREILKSGTAGLVVLTVGTDLAWAAPSAADAPLRVLSGHEGAWLSGLGEAIAPPSRAAGLVDYVDHHLAIAPADSLLALRYLDVPPPYIDFYRPALAALRTAYGDPPKSSDPRWTEIIAALGAGRVAGASPLFLFAVRLDAIDVAYGTRAGFTRLGIDYLPHIEPERNW